jgi:arginyl-tRNA synthetase
LQVRPQGDAIYPSRINPWSEYLTGKQGARPAWGDFDPLKWMIMMTHGAGLEFHAWFNPFRLSSISKEGKSKEELINRKLDLTDKQMDEVSEKIGIGSIRFYINQISPEKSITFKWDEALSFERGCASIQYAHARACKLLNKTDFDEYEEVRCDYELEDEEKELVLELSKFTEVIRQSAQERRIHHLTEYTMSLSKAFNKFYKSQQVIGSEQETVRLKLVDASRITLKNSLKLLGIKAPEYM